MRCILFTMHDASLFCSFVFIAIAVYVAIGTASIVSVHTGESFVYGACCLPTGDCLEVEASECVRRDSVNGTGRFLGSATHCTDFPAGMCYSSPCPDNTAAVQLLGQCTCNSTKPYSPAVALPKTCFNVTLEGCITATGQCVDAEPVWCTSQSYALLGDLCTESGAGACSDVAGCILMANATVCASTFVGRTFYLGSQCISANTNFGG